MISKSDLKVGHLVLIDVENAVNLERKEYYAVVMEYLSLTKWIWEMRISFRPF